MYLLNSFCILHSWIQLIGVMLNFSGSIYVCILGRYLVNDKSFTFFVIKSILCSFLIKGTNYLSQTGAASFSDHSCYWNPCYK